MRDPKLFLAVLTAFAIPLSANAGTIFADNFSTGAYATGSSTTAITGTIDSYFQVIDGTNVDFVASGNFGITCEGSPNCIDTGGSGGNADGNLASIASYGPGTYTLSFELTGSQRGYGDTTVVTFGNYSQTFILNSGDIEVISVPVTVGSGGSVIDFDNPINTNVGNVLDYVDLSSASAVSATPEPSSLALLGTGLLGAAGLLRRRVSAR